jgi:hypothetical protein
MQWAFAGKHLGKEISELPTSYLEFVEKNFQPPAWYIYDCQRESRQEASDELKRRKAAMTNTIYDQLIKTQQEMPTLVFDATNPHFKNHYASLGQVIKTILPTLNKYGLSFTQLVDFEGQTQFVKTVLFNAAGEKIESRQVLAPTKQDPQGYGSAITYAKRYSLVAMLGLDAEKDDDANEASTSPTAGTTNDTKEASKSTVAAVAPAVAPNDFQNILATIQQFCADNNVSKTQINVVTKGKALEVLSYDELVKAAEALILKYGKKSA